MTGSHRDIVVEARAGLILADQPSAKAYAAYFETQMRRGRIRRMLFSSYLWFACTGTVLTGLGPTGIGETPTG